MTKGRQTFKAFLLSGAAFAALVAAIPAAAQQTPAPQQTPAVAAPAETGPIPVRVGVHDQYTRIVFDFPRLTGYSATQQGDRINIAFDNPAAVATPKTQSPLVRGLGTGKDANGNTSVFIDVAGGTSFKHYRLARRVVIDVYGSDVATAAQPKPSMPPQTAQKTPAPAVAPPAPVAPTPAATAEKPAAPAQPATPATPVTPPAVAIGNVIIDKVTAADSAVTATTATQEQPAATPAEPTSITLSTIEPAQMAAFVRHGTLWIVMDNEAAGAVQPTVRGPDAGFLGKPKIMTFEGGTAFRYVMPPGRHLGVTRKNLTWSLSLNDRPQPAPPSRDVTVEFDAASKKAKLLVEMGGNGKVLSLQDSAIGDTLYVLTGEGSQDRVSIARKMPDLEILPAAIGMVVRPIRDDLRVNRIQNFVLVTAPNGIAATPGATGTPARIGEGSNTARLFDFPNWRQGGIVKFADNKHGILDSIAGAKTPQGRNDMLMRLALLYFANNFGHETLGILRVLSEDTPEIAETPNFIALRGAAAAMAGYYEDALKDLSNPALSGNPEISLWVGYAAAATEQWQMAGRFFPADNKILSEYPANIAVPFTIYMAESALRLGRTDTAATLLNSLNAMGSQTSDHYLAAINYLRGEAARQEGNTAEAIRIWKPVAQGLDQLYHTKASIALVNLQLQEKQIDTKQAIDAIDSLRFAWRGDGLEVQIMHNLGLLKARDGQYLAALQDLKTASTLADGLLSDSDPIREDMARIFTGIFNNDGTTARAKPLEAVSIFNEFGALMPQGQAGVNAKLSFADYLMQMDLVPRAAALLEQIIGGGEMPPQDLPATGAKLAAAYLLDNKAVEALSVLDRTENTTIAGDLRTERGLLRARALSTQKQTDAAIAVLNGLEGEAARRMRSDVYWRAGRWSDAAASILPLLPAAGAALDDESARLALNAAVAYKLAGDAAGLQKIRADYGAAIAQTKIATPFAVVTRDGGLSALSDRDTILKIAGEVDMFKGFLDGYKAASGAIPAPAETQALPGG